MPGNEANIGYPPSSSDEAAMFYALAGLPAMVKQTALSTAELIGKILITDGMTAHTLLDGVPAKIDLSTVHYGNFTERTVLRTRPLPLEEAISTMNQANKCSEERCSGIIHTDHRSSWSLDHYYYLVS